MLRPKFEMLVTPKPPDWFAEIWYLRVFWGAFFKYQLRFYFWKFLKFRYNIWNDNFRKSRVPHDKLIAMVMLDNLGNQK